MPRSMTDAERHTLARLAGALVLAGLLCPMLDWLLVFAPLNANTDALATARNVLAHASRYRIGVAVELGFSLSGIALAACLYLILEPVHRALATLGLLWKVAESVLVAASALVTVLALQLLGGQASLGASEQPQLQGLVGLFLNVRHAASFVAAVFLGAALVVFFYLFLRARLIPRALAGFGLVSYALVLVAALRGILAPGSATTLDMGALNTILAVPSIFTEIGVGIWLMARGLGSRGPANRIDTLEGPPTLGPRRSAGTWQT